MLLINTSISLVLLSLFRRVSALILPGLDVLFCLFTEPSVYLPSSLQKKLRKRNVNLQLSFSFRYYSDTLQFRCIIVVFTWNRLWIRLQDMLSLNFLTNDWYSVFSFYFFKFLVCGYRCLNLWTNLFTEANFKFSCLDILLN